MAACGMVTTALLRDVMAWGSILALVSDYDIVQFDTMMTVFVAQHVQDTCTDLGIMGYRRELTLASLED